MGIMFRMVYMIDFNVDIEMRLLNGSPIFVNDIGYVYALKLKEICDIGLTLYNQFINLLCIEPNTLNNNADNISTFECLIEMCKQNLEMKTFVSQAISVFLKKDILINIESSEIFIGENLLESLKENKFEKISILTKDNYNDLKFIIKLQNGLCNSDEKNGYNPEDEKARQIIEKWKKSKQKISRQKNNDLNQNLNLIDLISILASNSNNLNLLNIWDLTIYQFNDQFARIKILDDYNINIKYLLAGAKSEDVNLKHWLCKINSVENQLNRD